MSTPEPATRAKWLPRGPGVMSGFSTTVGVLLAVLLAAVVVAIIKPLTLVFFALFITLGLEPVIRWLESKGMKRPLALGTVLGVGLLIFGVVDAMTGTIFVLILTLYFVVSLDRMKQAFSLLVPKTKRANVMDITEEITGSVGSYLGGMVVLAFCNAVFSLIVMTVFGVPFSLVLAMLALFITMIPLIGSDQHRADHCGRPAQLTAHRAVRRPLPDHLHAGRGICPDSAHCRQERQHSRVARADRRDGGCDPRWTHGRACRLSRGRFDPHHRQTRDRARSGAALRRPPVTCVQCASA